VPTSLALGGNDMVHIAYGIPSRELLRYVTSEDVKIDNDEYRRIISESKIESFQNYPNPANPVTTISFTLQAADPLLVKIRMYDIRGHLVKTVHDDLIQSGNYNLVWDGTNDKGASVPSGIYFCVLSTEGEERSIKLSLIH
jgi:flagellar hook assembly protein FlgD